jgi:phosphatidate cytidylyltransferase
VRELSRIRARRWALPISVNIFYWLTALFLMVTTFLYYEHGLLLFAFTNVLHFMVGLWLARGKSNNETVLTSLTFGAFGLLYCVLFPLFAFKLVSLESGGHWFLFLLLVVFFGDTFAYFGGRWFGRSKMMPDVSPNKTWAGSISGLLGSSLAGTIQITSAFPYVPLLHTLLFCVFCGLVAQSGDLLISLVKRVAQVKDSGGLMPGHGGILDRLDGIFIACPLVYAFALYVKA